MATQASQAPDTSADLFKDFDHYNPIIGPDGTPSAYFEAMRDQVVKGQRIGRSDKYGGMWIVGGYAESMDVIRNTQVFSNERVIWPNYELGDAVLLMAGQDDPEHQFYRRFFNPTFTPGAAMKLADGLRVQINKLIDGFVDKGETDICESFTSHVPAVITASMLGVSPDNAPMYRNWRDAMSKGHQNDPEGAAKTVAEMTDWVQALIDRRRAEGPGEDVFSHAIHKEVDGRRLTDWELRSLFVLILLAGYDNTFLSMSALVWRLAWDNDLRRRLVRNPILIPGAFDECMRMYTPPHPTRLVKEDIEFHGTRMSAGDTIMYCAPVANRDPAKFEYPDSFIPDRQINPHLALGAGIHRCMGAHLLRVEARVMTEELLKRLPEFHLDTREGKEARWEGGQVAGFWSVNLVY